MCIMTDEIRCPNETCSELCSQLRAQAEHFKIENEMLRISLKDCAHMNETAIRELRRLLEKETSLVNILNAEITPDQSGMFPTCSGCAHFRQQAKAVREANAQEYQWVVHFAKTSKNLRLELEDALLQEKIRFAQLKSAYDELSAKKTDPFNRDGEIQHLRSQLAEAKVNQSNANQTALMANKVADTLQKELSISQQQVAALEIEKSNNLIKIRALEEIVDTCRRSSDLRDCSVGQCSDYVCKRRVMDLYAREKEMRIQMDILQCDRAHHLNEISRLRHDAEQWHGLMTENKAKESAKESAITTEEPPLKCAKLKSTADGPPKPVVMDNELTMNLKSLFTIFPGWSEEELDEAAMFRDFLEDIDPSERDKNLMWIYAACHPNETSIPSDHNAERLLRKSFGACLKAMGGVSKKRNGKTIWTNVRQNRCPIFKKRL